MFQGFWREGTESRCWFCLRWKGCNFWVPQGVRKQVNTEVFCVLAGYDRRQFSMPCRGTNTLECCWSLGPACFSRSLNFRSRLTYQGRVINLKTNKLVKNRQDISILGYKECRFLVWAVSKSLLFRTGLDRWNSPSSLNDVICMTESLKEKSSSS